MTYPIISRIIALKPNKKYEKYLIQDMKNVDELKFLNDASKLVLSINSSLNDNEYDPEVVINKFLKECSDIVNSHAPLRTLTRKESKLKTKPWITKSILKSIHKKNGKAKLLCQYE